MSPKTIPKQQRSTKHSGKQAPATNLVGLLTNHLGWERVGSSIAFEVCVIQKGCTRNLAKPLCARSMTVAVVNGCEFFCCKLREANCIMCPLPHVAPIDAQVAVSFPFTNCTMETENMVWPMLPHWELQGEANNCVQPSPAPFILCSMGVLQRMSPWLLGRNRHG